MSSCENLIRNSSVLDGSVGASEPLYVVLRYGMICAIDAIHHSIAEEDMRRILRHPATIIGSDGLPNDPLPARRFGPAQRGFVREGYSADLTLFDPESIIDTATYADPIEPAIGIAGVWVNGVLVHTDQGTTGQARVVL